MQTHVLVLASWHGSHCWFVLPIILLLLLAGLVVVLRRRGRRSGEGH